MDPKSRIQELRDNAHVRLSFLPERGVTGMLKPDVSCIRDVIDERLDDEILSHVGCTVEHERLRVDVVEAVDDRPPCPGFSPNPPDSPRQNVTEHTHA